MNKSLDNRNIFLLVKSLWKYLSKIRKRQIKILTVLVILSSFSEFISIYSLVPFLAVISDPDALTNNMFIKDISKFFSINSADNLVLYLTIVFLLATLSAGFMRVVFNYYSYRISASIGSDLSTLSFKTIINRPYTYHLTANSNNLVTTVAKDITEIIYLIIFPSFHFISALFISFTIFLTLSIINFTITLSSTIIITFLYFLFVKFSSLKITNLSKRNLRLSQNLIKLAQESLGGIRDIILSNNQNYFIKRFSFDDYMFRREEAFGNFLSIVPKLIIEPTAIVIIASFGFYIIRFGDSNQAIPILGALTFSGVRLLPFAQRIYEGITLPRLVKSRLINLLRILEDSPLKNERITRIKKFNLKNKIELKEISYKYDNESSAVLENINLTIGKGEKIGFVGQTGSGKSTLLDLLMGLIEPNSGSFLIDDHLFSEGTNKFKKAWQSSFMHVPQNIFLADASIAENIAFGLNKEDIDFKKILEASKKAQLDDFVTNTNNGFDTLVGERGIRLSGGQRQRIGIARALYKNSKIIFLDEATSALDEKTEQKIMNSFNYLGNDVTILIISHRINTLRFCDKIYEIDSGKLFKKNLF